MQPEKTSKHNLQIQLVREVLRRTGNEQQAAEVLCSLLSIKREAAIRRLRDRTNLNPQELQVICRHFGISLDRYIHEGSDNVIFHFNAFLQPVRDFESYIDQLLQNLDLALQVNEAEIYYATQEITPFQYFYYPELTAFKLYVYGLTVWDLAMVKGRPCSLDLLTPSVLDKGRECTRLYARLPSVDLWGVGLLKHSISQIEYLSEMGRFDPPDMALTVCDQLLAMLQRLEEMARLGKKFFRTSRDRDPYGTFDLHYNELVHTNNTILLRSPTLKLLFTTFSNPNFLRTADTETYSYFEQWFENTIQRSTAISIHSEKYRKRFFNQLRRQVEQSKQKITASLN